MVSPEENKAHGMLLDEPGTQPFTTGQGAQWMKVRRMQRAWSDGREAPWLSAGWKLGKDSEKTGQVR